MEQIQTEVLRMQLDPKARLRQSFCYFYLFYATVLLLFIAGIVLSSNHVTKVIGVPMIVVTICFLILFWCLRYRFVRLYQHEVPRCSEIICPIE
jgi:uncharacterized membrane protein YhaH (DUF805 family)